MEENETIKKVKEKLERERRENPDPEPNTLSYMLLHDKDFARAYSREKKYNPYVSTSDYRKEDRYYPDTYLKRTY